MENKNDKDYESVAVIAVFFDANGKITGGDYSLVDNVKASSKTPFSIDALDSEYATDSYEAYATEW